MMLVEQKQAVQEQIVLAGQKQDQVVEERLLHSQQLVDTQEDCYTEADKALAGMERCNTVLCCP